VQNCKVKVKVTLEQATKAHSGARWGGWSASRPGRFNSGKDQVPIIQDVSRLVDITAGGDFLGLCDQQKFI